MSLTFKNKKVDSYFRYMKNWDIDSKKDIIIKLTKSINDKEENKHDFSSCFGAWEDDRSAEEIIADIRSSRVNSSEIENF